MRRGRSIAIAALLAASCSPGTDRETATGEALPGETQQGVETCGGIHQPICSSPISNNPWPHSGCQFHLYASSQGTCETCGYPCSIYWCSVGYPPPTPVCPYTISGNPSPHNGCDSGSFSSGGTCRICGDYNQYACPFTNYPYTYNGCRLGWGNFNGYCNQCGGDNQTACPYSMNGNPAPHNQCWGGHKNVGGVCYACGGAGQPTCPYAVSWNQAPDQYCNSNLVNVNGTCTAGPVVNTIGYGQMGRRDGGHADVCASGLTPQNVDSRYSTYPPAPDGWFSCWNNSPDVNCYSQPKLYSYIWIRRCYQPPNGGPTVYYGCDTCP